MPTLANIWQGIQDLLADRKETARLSAEVSDLKVQLTASTAEVATLKASLAERDTALTAKDSEVTAAKADAAKAQDEAKAANDAKAQAEAALDELKKNPSAQAVEIAAKAGVKAADRPAATGPAAASKFVTSAEFSAMTPKEKMDFSVAGGRIKD